MSACSHHWVIEPQEKDEATGRGIVPKGVCKHCGAVKEFPLPDEIGWDAYHRTYQPPRRGESDLYVYGGASHIEVSNGYISGGRADWRRS